MSKMFSAPDANFARKRKTTTAIQNATKRNCAPTGDMIADENTEAVEAGAAFTMNWMTMRKVLDARKVLADAKGIPVFNAEGLYFDYVDRNGNIMALEN